MKKIISLLLFTLIVISSLQNVEGTEYFPNHQDFNEYCLRAKNVSMSQAELHLAIEKGMLGEIIAHKSELKAKEITPNIEYDNWPGYSGVVNVDTSSLTGMSVNDTRVVTLSIVDSQGTVNSVPVSLTLTRTVIFDNSVDEPVVPDVQPDVQPEPTVPPSIVDIVDEVIADAPNYNTIVEIPEESIVTTVPIDDGEIPVTPKKQKKVTKEKEDRSFLEWLFSGDDILVMIPFLNIPIHLTPLSATQFSISIVWALLILLLVTSDVRILYKYNKAKEKYLWNKYKL